jgi:hypothetical protein
MREKKIKQNGIMLLTKIDESTLLGKEFWTH